MYNSGNNTSVFIASKNRDEPIVSAGKLNGAASVSADGVTVSVNVYSKKTSITTTVAGTVYYKDGPVVHLSAGGSDNQSVAYRGYFIADEDL